MTTVAENIIRNAYDAFNNRNIDGVLLVMQPDVQWPNGWEGGYMQGHNAVRDYWTRQWKEINPRVTPVSFKETSDSRTEVTVHQVVKEMQGTVLLDGMVKHIYTIKNGLIAKMEIEHS